MGHSEKQALFRTKVTGRPSRNAEYNCDVAICPFGDVPGSQRMEVPEQPAGPAPEPVMLRKQTPPAVPFAPAMPHPILVMVTEPVEMFCARDSGADSIDANITPERNAIFTVAFIHTSMLSRMRSPKRSDTCVKLRATVLIQIAQQLNQLHLIANHDDVRNMPDRERPSHFDERLCGYCLSFSFHTWKVSLDDRVRVRLSKAPSAE